MNDPVPGRWYLNVAVPLHRTMRVCVTRVTSHMVYVVDDPEPGEFSPEVAWRLGTFRVVFRACEDVSHSVASVACPKDCPVCSHPRYAALVDRVLQEYREKEQKKSDAAYERRRTAARARKSA